MISYIWKGGEYRVEWRGNIGLTADIQHKREPYFSSCFLLRSPLLRHFFDRGPLPALIMESCELAEWLKKEGRE